MTEENKKTLKEICWDRDRFPLEIPDIYGEYLLSYDYNKDKSLFDQATSVLK
jgi:hypothetical protein